MTFEDDELRRQGRAEAVAALVASDPRWYHTERWRSFLRHHAPAFLALFQKLAG